MGLFKLNYTSYPLVVGQADKYTFEGWRECGSSIKLEAYDGEEYVEPDELVWSNSNPESVVLQDGVARALRTGYATITVTNKNGETAACDIYVIDNYMRSTVQFIEPETECYMMSIGDTHMCQAAVFPKDVFGNGAINQILLYSSEDANIVSVDETGKMTALTEGETVITMTSQDVGRFVRCKVIVDASGDGVRFEPDRRTEEKPEYVPFGLKLSRERLVLAQGESYPVYAVVTPAMMKIENVKWSVEDVAESHSENLSAENLVCGKKGLELSEAYQNIFGAAEVQVTAKVSGTARLKAEYKLGEGSALAAYCEIEVRDLADENVVASDLVTRERLLHFSEREICMVTDQVAELPILVDESISRENLVWTTSDEGIVTVNPKGILKGYASGVAQVTVTHRKKDYLIDVITVKVEAGNACLRNLHICKETITSESVMLLWNRDSLDRFWNFKGYGISWRRCGEEQWSEPVYVNAMGYKVEGLEPDTEYTFRVEAVWETANEEMGCNDTDGENMGKSEGNGVYVSETITAHTLPACTVQINVTQAPYFAKGNGRILDTAAIQRAINDCPDGGEVYLPANRVFLSGALFLKSNMTFRVDGVLLGSTYPEHYPRIISRWEGWRRLEIPGEKWPNRFEAQPDNHMVYASLLTLGTYEEGYAKEADYPHNIENVIICGKGMINGNGFKLAYHEGPNNYTGNGGLPVPPSIVDNATFRGSALRIHNGKSIYVKDVTIGYAPGWTVHALYCDGITFDHVNVVSMGDGVQAEGGRIRLLNGDGIDPESCIRVNIVNCYFHTGDDAVALKSGRNREGNELAKPVAYVRVTDCCCYDCLSGITLGSEIASGVHDVLVQNNRIESCTIYGLWIKSAGPRGGVVKHIQYKDCYVSDAVHGIMVGITAHGTTVNAADSLPEICELSYENITFEHMRGEEVELIGVPGSKLHNILFRNIKVAGSKAGARYLLKHVRDMETD